MHTVRGTAADVGDIAEGYRCALTQQNAADALIDQGEKLDTAVSAKAEHPFRVIRRQFGFSKNRYRGMKKKTQQLVTLFTLSNPWMLLSKLMGATA